MSHVDVFAWNPTRPIVPGRLGRSLPLRRRVNNFGDLLGPLIVTRLLRRHGVTPQDGHEITTRLFSVGSVLHFANSGDVIWGTGVNGKVSPDLYRFSNLDVRAVRGPKTRDFLLTRGITTPEVFGDPALLLPELCPDLRALSQQKQHAVTVVPNLNDLSVLKGGDNTLDPRAPLSICLSRIVQSEFVTGSSLHAIVVAEAFGIPARLVKSPNEHPFKYEDYYQSTGRANNTPARDVASALQAGGEPAPEWESEPLLRSFPLDLWLR